MNDKFSRTELLFGPNAMEKLANSRVAIFGIGGVGSYTAEALARSGIGAIDIIDSDKVCPSNINRQLYALHSTIGRYKTDVAKERILDINPNIKINTYNIFFSQETSNQFDFKQYDYVVDAIDTVKGKIELIMCSKNANVPIICSMGAGNKINPEGFITADIYETSVCPLAKVMRREMKKRNIKDLKVVYSKELPIKPDSENIKVASNAFVPSVAGLIMASVVVKDLIKK